MTILALDVSTHTGYAVITDGKLVDWGLIEVSSPGIWSKDLKDRPLTPEYAYIGEGHLLGVHVVKLLKKHPVDLIYIEQTNQGRNRTTQKQLEFIHCILLEHLRLCEGIDSDYPSKVRYVDTSAWRSGLNIKMSKDQRKHNKAVKDKKVRGKITPKHLVVAWVNDKFGLKLKLKDNNEADAIAMAQFGLEESAKTVAVPVVDDILSTFKVT